MAIAVLDKLEQGEQQALHEYRELVLAIVEGHELDESCLRRVLLDASKTTAGLRADVDAFQSRKNALASGDRAGDLEQQLQALTRQRQESFAALERVRLEYEQRKQEFEQFRLVSENQERALRHESHGLRTESRALLLRTADPAIEIRCGEIRRQIRQHDESRRFNLDIIEGKRNFNGILLQPAHRKSKAQCESEHKAAKHHVARLDKVDAATRQQAEARVSQCEQELERIAAVEATVESEQREIERLSAELTRLEASKLDWRNAAIR